MKHNYFGLTMISLLFISGCGDSTVPEESPGNGPTASASVSTVRIHIDGFKKSKSGAT